jgi:hypothetical protein
MKNPGAYVSRCICIRARARAHTHTHTQVRFRYRGSGRDVVLGVAHRLLT